MAGKRHPLATRKRGTSKSVERSQHVEAERLANFRYCGEQVGKAKTRKQRRARAAPSEDATTARTAAAVAIRPVEAGSRSVESVPQRRVGLAILGGALVVGLALRVWLSLTDDGIYWPDEIYQSLEPAHRLVFGYGLVAWEFKEGARNWALPGLIAGVLKVASVIGLDDPRAYLTFLRFTLSVASLGAALGAYLLARAYGGGTLAASAGAALIALAAPAIYLGPRALSEVPSAATIPLGFALALWPRAGMRRHAVGTSLLGISVLFRLQNGLFAAGLVAILAARRQWRQAIEASIVLAVWVGFLGLLDQLTWGGWFASVFNYISFNLDPVRTAIFEKPPADYYLLVILTSMGLGAIALIALAAFGATRAPGITLVAVGFVLVHSAIAHKELRFVLPALPMFASVAGLGVQRFLDRRGGRTWEAAAFVGAVLVCALVSAATFRQLTFRDVGQSVTRGYFDVDGKAQVVSASESAFDQPGPLNRMLLAAYRQKDLCGLKVEPLSLIYTGGYSYFHRAVPLYGIDSTIADSSYFNFVIALGTVRAGDVRASDGGFSLVKVRASCTPDPAFYGAFGR